jgi:mannan endo-1,4-beta-mannosidase
VSNGGVSSGGAGKGGSSTGGASGGFATGGSTHSGPWRIAPFGDSITGTTCYPQLLSKQLKDNGKTNFSFVGGVLNNQSCSGAANVQSEGHGGYKVTDLVSGGAHASELSGWCTSDDADIVLFHYGTNDAWTPSIPIANITSAYTTVLQCLRSANPNVIVFVAKIIPMHPAGCEASTCQYNQRVIELNNAIPGWASTNSTGASPIYVVDVYSAFNADQYLPNSTNTADGVHPNPAGSQLISNKWYDALLARSLP